MAVLCTLCGWPSHCLQTKKVHDTIHLFARSCARYSLIKKNFTGRLSNKPFLILLLRMHTHTRLTALFPGLPRWASTRKVKPIWILLKQETVSGSGISWLYASLHLTPDRQPRQYLITQFFYRPDALPATQPTALKAKIWSICHDEIFCVQSVEQSSWGEYPYFLRYTHFFITQCRICGMTMTVGQCTTPEICKYCTL